MAAHPQYPRNESPEWRGFRAYCAEQYQEALALLTEAITSQADAPTVIFSLGLRGRVYRALTRLDDALADYTEAVRRARNEPKPENYTNEYYYSGCALLAAGQPQAALDMFNELVLRLRSNNAGRVAYSNIPRGTRQDYARALEDLNRGIDEMPDERVLYLCRGLVKFGLADWDGAEDDYDQGLLLSGYEEEEPEPKRGFFFFGRKPQVVETPPKDRLEDALRRQRDDLPRQRETSEFSALRIRPVAIAEMAIDMEYAEMFGGHVQIYSITETGQSQTIKGKSDAQIIRQLEAEGWLLTGKSIIYDDGANTPDYYFKRPKR